MKNTPAGMLRGNLRCLIWACEDFIERLKEAAPLNDIEMEILEDKMASLQKSIKRYTAGGEE